MYLATFRIKEIFFLGCKVGDCLCQLDRAYEYYFEEPPPVWFQDMRSLLTEGEAALKRVQEVHDRIQQALTTAKEHENLLAKEILHRLRDVRLAAPILNPEKIICIGLNYKDHCLEQNVPLPKNPILFSKFSTAIIGPEGNIIRPKLTKQLDFESELAFVIGKKGRHIPIDKAMEYVAGYTIFNDVIYFIFM